MMKAGRILVGCLLLGLVLGGGCGREQGDPWVLRLADREVPLSEIVFEFNRLHGVNQWEVAPEDVRTEFVETYARKEVLVEKARQMYPELPQREQMIFDRWLEKQAVAHFWRSFRQGIEVPESYIDSLAEVVAEERYLRHIICQYPDDAREIYAKIEGGADFEAVADEYRERNPNAIAYADVGFVNRPSLDPVIGEALFGLSDAGAVAEPCETQRYGWHVIRCDTIRTIDPETARLRAEQIGPENYRVKVVRERVEQMQKDYNFSVVRENLGPIQRRFRAMYDSLNADKREGKNVDYQALAPPIHRFPTEERVLPLVRWTGGEMTVGDFVNTLWKVDLDYWPTIGDANKMATQVIRRMHRWAFMEEAKKAGTLEDPEIARQMERKQDELYLDRFHEDKLRVYADQITEADVRAYWEANEEKYVSGDLVGYGFIRFPPDARDLAMRTYETVLAGTEFGMAATQARRSDERVVFEADVEPTNGPPYPELTAAAMAFEPDESGPHVSEPVEVQGDWVIFRVYFRSHPRQLTFESAKEYVTRDVQRLAMEDSLLSMLDEYEEEFGLELNLGAIR
ncbi:MAG: hypothetical protein GF330_12300 [Candidatus Eisenbacteria bacterium]|nr:hypothetical protein [Candidatus Eisenbacteria bacterium]